MRLTSPDNDLTRRTFVASAGYALAVLPITAWAVETPTTGLETLDTTVTSGKDKLPVYIARPKGAGPFPTVIVIHEIFGVHAYIKDVCRRLANAGYAAVAPDLFFRYGDATKISDIDKLRAEIVSKAAQSEVLGDLDALVAWFGNDKVYDTKRLGITGFCWGGNVTWMYAERNPAIKAGGAWYGRLSGDKTPKQPLFPMDGAVQLKVPVLGLYGDKDKGIPLDQVEAMRKELSKGKSGSKINVYKDSEHAFHADYRPSYNEKTAKEGWEDLLKWFKEHGL